MEVLTIDNVPCQCEIYEICRDCAPSPEAYERACRQRQEVMKDSDEKADGII